MSFDWSIAMLQALLKTIRPMENQQMTDEATRINHEPRKIVPWDDMVVFKHTMEGTYRVGDRYELATCMQRYKKEGCLPEGYSFWQFDIVWGSIEETAKSVDIGDEYVVHAMSMRVFEYDSSKERFTQVNDAVALARAMREFKHAGHLPVGVTFFPFHIEYRDIDAAMGARKSLKASMRDRMVSR